METFFHHIYFLSTLFFLVFYKTNLVSNMDFCWRNIHLKIYNFHPLITKKTFYFLEILNPIQNTWFAIYLYIPNIIPSIFQAGIPNWPNNPKNCHFLATIFRFSSKHMYSLFAIYGLLEKIVPVNIGEYIQ